MRYRKKPVVVEAFCWTGGRDQKDDPEWIVRAMKTGLVRLDAAGTPRVRLCMDTREGRMFANRGDWIIRDVDGEIYPCKASIFAATYEPVEETP